MVIIEKWKKEHPISAIYYDGAKDRYFVKRFILESSDKVVSFISENELSFKDEKDVSKILDYIFER